MVIGDLHAGAFYPLTRGGCGKPSPGIDIHSAAATIDGVAVTTVAAAARGSRQGICPMWFQDLSPCTYFPVDVKLVAVGWLERGRPFATGDVVRDVFDALVEMKKDPWQPMVCRGLHGCDLCRFGGEARGCANLIVPSDAALYVAPELIVHYINAHSYQPPPEFCRAVLACPPDAFDGIPEGRRRPRRRGTSPAGQGQ